MVVYVYARACVCTCVCAIMTKSRSKNIDVSFSWENVGTQPRLSIYATHADAYNFLQNVFRVSIKQK